jgi:hypothetical protein
MAKKNRIPKKVAGFKIPKMIRKSPVVSGLLASDTGRKVLADALMAGAAAAVAVLAADNKGAIAEAGEDAAKGSVKAGGIVKDVVKGVSSAMAEVIGDAARAVIPGAAAKEEPESPRPVKAAARPRTLKAPPAHH